MVHDFIGRVTVPYDKLTELFRDWSLISQQIWVYEHQADSTVKRTHCHVFVKGCERTPDGLKKLVSWKRLNVEKGNAGSSFKKYEKDPNDNVRVDKPELSSYRCLTYMSKGVVNTLKMCKGEFANEIAENSRLLWKEPEQKKTAIGSDNYYQLCMKIRESCTMEYVVNTVDDFGHPIMECKKVIRDFDEMYNKLMDVLDENGIRTSEYDIDRWILTIVRSDVRMGKGVRERMRKKYWDNV